MKKLFVMMSVCSCVLIGCEIKEPPTCVQGMEKCEMDVSGMGIGIYQTCTSDGEWGGRFVCGGGCNSQNQCAKSNQIPACDHDGEIKCLNDLNIAFECHNQAWIPQICADGCNEESGCLAVNHSCSSSDDNCIDVDDMGSIQTKCRDNIWTVYYCPKNVNCDGKQCEDSEILSCGEKSINCKESVDGWKSGKCEEDKCLVSECLTGYHVVDEERDNIFCERNTKDNCGSHGKACPEGEACQENTGKCGCEANEQACDGSCVDIKNNINHCGGCNKPCQIDNSDEVTCNNGTCKVFSCESGFEISENGETCEKIIFNDVTACGETGIDCTTTLSGWVEGECREGMCVVSKCIDGMHPYTTEDDSVCEINNDEHCGEHGSGCDSAVVLNSTSVACSMNGQCEATECDDGYHVFESACEKDDNTNCGQHDVACIKDNVPGSETVSCDSGQCLAVTCDSDHLLNGDVCLDKTCTDGSTKCVNSGKTGKIYKCTDNEWKEDSTCTDNHSCKNDGSGCGECINDKIKCTNENSTGKYQTCTDGQWGAKNTCPNNNSCNSAGTECGDCVNDVSSCLDNNDIGQFTTCNNGENSTSVCEGNASCQNDQSCGQCKLNSTKCESKKVYECPNALWVSESTCAFTCESGTKCCTNSKTKCSNKKFYTCNNNSWGTGSACSLGCESSSKCCTNGTKKCDSGKSYTCSNNSWGTGTSCTYGCDDTIGCYPDCTPGTMKCENNYHATCTNAGKWDETFCTNGCDNSGCYACTNGTHKCEANKYYTCSNHSWGTGTYCSNGCDNNGCYECSNSSHKCENDKYYTCKDHNWTSIDCEHGCSVNGCYDCTNGMHKCENGKYYTCVNHTWSDVEFCHYGCDDSGCFECGGDLQTDTNNCGSCGHVCSSNDVVYGTSFRCISGECNATACKSELASLNVELYEGKCFLKGYILKCSNIYYLCSTNISTCSNLTDCSKIVMASEPYSVLSPATFKIDSLLSACNSSNVLSDGFYCTNVSNCCGDVTSCAPTKSSSSTDDVCIFTTSVSN